MLGSNPRPTYCLPICHCSFRKEVLQIMKVSHTPSKYIPCDFYLVKTKTVLLLERGELRRSGDVGVRSRRLFNTKHRENSIYRKLYKKTTDTSTDAILQCACGEDHKR